MWDFYKYVCIHKCEYLQQYTCLYIQKIYVELDDSDGVAGSAAVNTLDPTHAERILQYEISGMTTVRMLLIRLPNTIKSLQGNYRDAAACYERAIQEEPNELSHHEVYNICNFALYIRS